VTFIQPLGQTGKKKRHYEYTAIDDCTRLHVLRAYPTHDQKTAIRFIDHVLSKLPFEIEKVQPVTIRPFTRRCALKWSRYLEWSSIQPITSTSRPVVSCTWVKSDCQSSFGRSAANRSQGLRGRFCGCGVIFLSAVRRRQIVVLDGVVPSGARSSAIVSAPASRLSATSCPRSSRTRSVTARGVRFGDDRGRRE
jgi:hypothetical protein